MLSELKVTNFAIIDNIHIQFRTGLNILSGETGSGKSILLKSLGLLMGEKANADSVRTGADNALIEGSFDLSARPDIRGRLQEMGIDSPDDLLVVRRIVCKDKSRVYLNGSISTLTSLREVVAPLVEVAGHNIPLIEMTGQHENRHLLSRAYHLDLLDQYAGLSRSRSEFADSYRHLQELSREIEEIRQESRTRAQRLDFLIYQRDEIKSLDLRPGEEEEIENETKRFKHSARLSEFVEQVENLLSNDEGSAISRLQYILQRAADLRNIDPELVSKLEPLQQAKALIDDVGYELRDYTKSLDADPSRFATRLEELQSRLSALRQLQKKYGPTAIEILAALGAIENEINQLENSDALITEKELAQQALISQLTTKSKDLHLRRIEAARLLAAGVNDELRDLNMKDVTFSVATEELGALGPTGSTLVEFMTRVSKVEPARPLTKFASGGELSRILLSIKQVVGAGHFPRTYLFDEVDTGVSGPTAEKVGRKLSRMAKGQQVICVTHLPQVASFGDIHFFIHKVGTGGSKKGVQTEVVELRKRERIQEIARLISGEKISKTSLAHADQLLSESQAAQRL
jgi:DNA repair protein RecN (Recombination protein N)